MRLIRGGSVVHKDKFKVAYSMSKERFDKIFKKGEKNDGKGHKDKRKYN